MKDFMLIFISDDYQKIGLSPAEMQARMGKWFAWNTQMRKDGVVKHGDALMSTAKTVSGAGRVVSDGPFVEGKEIIGGYYVVTAADYEQAIEIAQGYPDYDLGGTVEIREVQKFDND